MAENGRERKRGGKRRGEKYLNIITEKVVATTAVVTAVIVVVVIYAVSIVIHNHHPYPDLQSTPHTNLSILLVLVLIVLLVQTPVLELVLSDCVGTRMSTSPRTSTNIQLRNRTKTSVRTITKY